MGGAKVNHAAGRSTDNSARAGRLMGADKSPGRVIAKLFGFAVRGATCRPFAINVTVFAISCVRPRPKANIIDNIMI